MDKLIELNKWEINFNKVLKRLSTFFLMKVDCDRMSKIVLLYLSSKKKYVIPKREATNTNSIQSEMYQSFIKQFFFYNYDISRYMRLMSIASSRL